MGDLAVSLSGELPTLPSVVEGHRHCPTPGLRRSVISGAFRTKRTYAQNGLFLNACQCGIGRSPEIHVTETDRDRWCRLCGKTQQVIHPFASDAIAEDQSRKASGRKTAQILGIIYDKPAYHGNRLFGQAI